MIHISQVEAHASFKPLWEAPHTCRQRQIVEEKKTLQTTQNVNVWFRVRWLPPFVALTNFGLSNTYSSVRKHMIPNQKQKKNNQWMAVILEVVAVSCSR